MVGVTVIHAGGNFKKTSENTQDDLTSETIHASLGVERKPRNASERKNAGIARPEGA